MQTFLSGVLIGLGALIGVLREVYLAKYFGASEAVDIYRVSIGVPLALSQGFALSYVNAVLEKAEKSLPGSNLVLFGKGIRLDIVIIFSIGLVTIPLQVFMLSPGVGHSIGGYGLFVSAWIMFAFVGGTFSCRTYLVYLNSGWLVTLFQISRNVLFIVLMNITHQMVGAYYSLAICTLLSSAPLPVLANFVNRHLRIRICKFDPENGEEPVFRGLGAKVVLVLVVIQVLYVSGRLFDRAVASLLPSGSVSFLEFSYSVVMAIVALVGTSLVLTALPAVNRLLSKVSWRIMIIAYVLFSFAAILVVEFINSMPLVITNHIYGGGGLTDYQLRIIDEVFSIQMYGVPFSIVCVVLVQRLQRLGRRSFLIKLLVGKFALRMFMLAVMYNELSLTLISWWFVISEFFIFTALFIMTALGCTKNCSGSNHGV